VSTRVKRTYNLPEPVVHAVRELAAKGIASSQDAVVELAIEELARRVREAEEEEAWSCAAADPLFKAEVGRLEREFASAGAETWPPA
jgi:Arc/MetJ-type ribon-helix-helix transcriptional regulator